VAGRAVATVSTRAFAVTRSSRGDAVKVEHVVTGGGVRTVRREG